MEIPARSSNHQAEIIGQGPSNAIANTMNKRLTPPNKNRDLPPVRKVISHCKDSCQLNVIFNLNCSIVILDIRLYDRRNDVTTEIDSLDNHSVMSVDSIEPKDGHDMWRKSRVHPHSSPIKNLITQWTTSSTAPNKSSGVESSDNEGKDFLSVSSHRNRQQGPTTVVLNIRYSTKNCRLLLF